MAFIIVYLLILSSRRFVTTTATDLESPRKVSQGGTLTTRRLDETSLTKTSTPPKVTFTEKF